VVSIQEVFERFLFRDLLGYLVPGAVAACALALCAPAADVNQLAVATSLPKLAAVTFVACYLCGFTCGAALDAIGELLSRSAKVARLLVKWPWLWPIPKFDKEPAKHLVAALEPAGARRYVQRLEDLALLTGHSGAAVLLLVLVRIAIAHASFAQATDRGPFSIAYRSMTTPVLVFLVGSSLLLLWYGAWCHRDARSLTALLANGATAKPNS